MFLVKICLFLSLIGFSLAQPFMDFPDTSRNRERFYKSGRRYNRSRIIFENNKNNLQNINYELKTQEKYSPKETLIQTKPDSIQILTEIPIQSELQIEINQPQQTNYQNNCCSGDRNKNNNNNFNIKLPLIFTKATIQNSIPKYNPPQLIQAYLVLRHEVKKIPRLEESDKFTTSNWNTLITDDDQDKDDFLETEVLSPTSMSLNEY